MGIWALEFDYREIMTIGVRKWMEDEWMTRRCITKIYFWWSVDHNRCVALNKSVSDH